METNEKNCPVTNATQPRATMPTPNPMPGKS